MAKADLRAMFPDVDTTCIQAFAAALWNMRAEDWHEHVARVDKETLERELSEAAEMRERLRPLMGETKRRTDAVEVTPEMIEAGLSCFWDLPELLGPSSEELAATVASSFRAMMKVRLAQSGTDA